MNIPWLRKVKVRLWRIVKKYKIIFAAVLILTLIFGGKFSHDVFVWPCQLLYDLGRTVGVFLILPDANHGQSNSEEYIINNKRFPSNFMFGVSSSAYQIEGGWNEDGKSASIWDYLTHTTPDYIYERDNGDIACDSYHKYEEDVAMLKELGVNQYRFSLAWTRILPKGLSKEINVAGVSYYRKLIELLKQNKIEPMVTLYHWDLPESLQEQGGFLNESIVQWYVEYARVCFELFGEDVKYWLTFNEAKQVCYGGYGAGTKAPGYKNEGTWDYICAHNLIKAHAATWHLYNSTYRNKQKGKVSLAIDTNWHGPASNKTEDLKAADTKLMFEFGWFAHPVILGDYPKIMKNRIAQRSIAEGFNKSRLPEFTDQEVAYIKGTYDYLGINTYTTSLVEAIVEPPTVVGKPTRYNDIGVHDYFLDSWKTTSAVWLRIVPFGMRKLMKYIKDNYNDPEILITENGVCDLGTLEDDDRVYYIQNYVSYLLDAIEKDNVRVMGYSHWSLMDNFEWYDGYKQKFGLYHIDFTSSNRTRTPKKSARFYQHLCRTHCLVEKCVE